MYIQQFQLQYWKNFTIKFELTVIILDLYYYQVLLPYYHYCYY